MRDIVALGMVAVFLCSVAGPAEAVKCKKDAVASGKTCMDAHENSVWTIEPTEPNFAQSLKQLKKLAEKGSATLAKLMAIAGIKQVGATSDDYGPDCPDDGAGCVDFFAVSLPGVTPSAFLTQIQAKALCRNSGKELPDNNTWTDAALGTPDPGTDDEATDCNIDGPPFAVTPTGSRANCVSDVEAFDMLGNLWEWVGDWVPRSTACGSWSFPGGDIQCLAGAATSGEPGALIRGGFFDLGSGAGVFAVLGTREPSDAFSFIGFRCAR